MRSLQDDYKMYLQKVLALREERKRRPLGTLKGFYQYFEHYSKIATTLQWEKATKAHLLGLGIAMSGLSQSKSRLGLFTDGFERSANRLAEALVALTMKKPALESAQILAWWIELSVGVIVGLLEKAQMEWEPRKRKQPIDPAFRDELVLLLLFYTDYPRLCFQEMGEALGVDKPSQPLFTALFEAVILVIALSSYSKEEEVFREALVGNFSERLKEDLEQILKGIEGLVDPFHPRYALLQEIHIALEKGDVEGVISGWLGLLELAGYPRVDFYQDLATLRSLFQRYMLAYQSSKENKSTVVHLVG